MKSRIYLFVIAAGLCLPAYSYAEAEVTAPLGATPVAGTVELPDLSTVSGVGITSTPIDTSPTIADARNMASVTAPELGLVQVLAEVIQKYPERTGAMAALRAAQARIGIAKADGGPQVDASANSSLNRNYGSSTTFTNNGTGTGTGNNFQSNGKQLWGFDRSENISIDASLPVYSGGRVRNNKRATEARARAQAAVTLQVTQDLVRTAIETYLNILRSEQLLDVAVGNLEVSKERSRVANVRFVAGAAAQLEVLRADATLADAAQRRVDASNSLAQYKAALNILMGLRPETPLRVAPVETLQPRIPIPRLLVTSAQTGSAEPKTGEAVPLEGTIGTLDNPSNDPLYAVALANRPTGAQYDELLRAAQYDIATAKAGKKPSLSLSLRTFFRNPLESLGSFALTFGLGLAQNLFDSGRTSSQVSEARALADQAKANVDLARLQVANQIEGALLNLDAAQKRATLSQVGVKAAQEALRAAQLGYEAGATTSLEVSDAQAALLLAEQQAVNARFDVANAQSNLSNAVGVLTVEGQQAYDIALRAEETRERQAKK